jgi:hypothetical protein
MIVYNIQNYRVFRLCPSSSVLQTLDNIMFWKLDLRTETDPVPETLCFLVFVEYWMMCKVPKPLNLIQYHALNRFICW